MVPSPPPPLQKAEKKQQKGAHVEPNAPRLLGDSSTDARVIYCVVCVWPSQPLSSSQIFTLGKLYLG